MVLNALLPTAPARVKILIVPIGQIKQDRFAAFVERLNREHVVHLRDITPDGRPNRNMFSPLAFPAGAMFYELTTHLPPPSHLALTPFDLYREPLALLAVADGAEMESTIFGKRESGTGRTLAERNMRSLVQDLEDLRDTYPKILVHQVLIFDYVAPVENPIPKIEGLVTIPPADQQKRTTMKAVMCDIASLLLAEMTGLAKSFDAMSSIDSPGQAPTMRQLNGSSWENEESVKLSRRNSQHGVPGNARSTSASATADRSHVRMSMPPVPSKGSPFGSGNPTPARPSTPGRSGLSNPPANQNDATNGTNSEPSSPKNSRPGTAEGFRTHSQDRVAVQGFGSGGLNDRWRSKSKCRSQILTGGLYLQAGRWSDAVKELAEGATVARSINDHLWHGKALELTLISIVMLGWAGIEFQVPAVLLPPQEKGSGTANSGQEADNLNPDQPRHLRHLQYLLPDLLERIIALYTRISAEHLPQLALSEAIIRFCKLLAAVHVADGQLGKKSFDMMVFGKFPSRSLTSPRFTISPTRTQICSTLFRAFPGSQSEVLMTLDRIVILSGIASVLGILGFHRKKAMVIKEVVTVLIGGLVDARTRGAAEVGIHPAAGLIALNGVGANGAAPSVLELNESEVEQGVDAFLTLLLRPYGIVSYEFGSKSESNTKSVDDLDAVAVARIQKQSAVRAFGMQSLKLNILRSCINVSEALPDFAGVLKYSSDLLRTAGSGIAPGPRREDALPTISREEQGRLVTNISKTLSLSRRLGLEKLAANYWDEFLLRGVKVEPLAASRTPIPHAKSVLPEATKARTSQDVNPFIYNPFLKQDTAAADTVLVAGEPAIFRLTLQNPYEIEVEVDSIRLDSDGAEFESSPESTILGPYRTQIVRLSGTAKEAGSLRITGALVQVHGCRETRFPIFTQPWAPESETKIKAIGLAVLEYETPAPSSLVQPLQPDCLEMKVISQQPVIVIDSTTLHQSSVMILEGERQTFSITLRNLSETTPADFLLFSFQDSTQEPLQTALSNRDATAAELYEYELIVAKKQALRLRSGDKKRFIAPGQSETFEFEILGKPGLTNGLIQVDYAYIGVPHDEVGEKFYTRQVSLGLTVTVNASVDVSRIDILPLHGSVPQPLWTRTGQGDQPHELTADKYCLMMIDLRNAWPSQMNIRLEGEDGAEITEHILPGNSSRVILPVRRIFLDDPHAPIPALNASRQRQFVVSTKISPDAERANRELFWFREHMLNTLHGTWQTTSRTPRSGTIELRSMRLTARMIEALKIDDVGIDISVLPNSEDNQASPTNIVYADEFFNLRVRITNRSARPIYPFLRLVPAMCHRPLEFTRKFACNGTLQQALPILEGKGATSDTVLGVTALCRGEFEISASVEETRIWEPVGAEEKGEGKDGGRKRADTQTMMNAALGGTQRRKWHSRQPCRIVVVDRE